MRARYAAFVTAVGAILVVTGIACVYWPVALVAAGVFLIGFGLTVDTT